MNVIWMIIPLILFGIISIEQSFADVEYSHEFNFENCEGILDVEEIKTAINRIENITVSSRELIPVDREPGLQTMCNSTFESQEKSISMTVVVMDSTNSAISLYEKNLDSLSVQDFEIKEYVTFWNNFDVVLNDQGLGSFMGSQYDKFFISFHTSYREDNSSLIDVEELRMLSTIVQKKILDLDDVPISPPNPGFDNDIGPTTDESSTKSGPAPIEDGYLLSPKKQISQGIDSVKVKCNAGLELFIKHNGSPVCVRLDTAIILEERNWGGMPPPCCKPTDVSSELIDATSSYMEEVIPTLDDFRNTLNESQDIETIFFKFGEPHYDIGRGIHIYVYDLNDSTQVWIGYADKILYVQHVDVKGNVLETIF